VAPTSRPEPMFNWLKAKLLADLSLNHRIPLAMSEALSGEAGALLQVNPDVPGCAERSASFIDLILKGANPRDLRCKLGFRNGSIRRHAVSSALGLL
jgi:hypothetical protein